jgi:D-alanyl-D-alanine carboxypeptidase
MIHLHAKHHHIEFPLLYAMAVLAIVLLSNIAQPLTQKNYGIIDTKKNKDAVLETPLVLFNPNAFSDISIFGKAYVVYDILTGTTIATYHENDILPLASITKVMMAETAIMHHEKDTPVTIQQRSIEDGYDLGLKKNQVWKLNELLKYTLVFSSNDGAQSVADTFGGSAAYVAQMNTDAQILGLPLIFTDPAGRDQKGNIGGLGSALSVAQLFSVARKNFPQVLDATTKSRASLFSSTGKVTGIPNTNHDVENLTGIEGSKTGFTDKAGGNLGVIVDITVGHPVVIVVLGSTKEGRFSDVETLYKALKNSIIK